MDIDRETLLLMYRNMVVIREFEEKVRELFTEGKIVGAAHSYVGEEAVAVGVAANLRPDDWITSTHRGHGHLIAKGGDPKFMFAELYGKRTGYCKGKGGSQHIADLNMGILGANGIVGGGIPIANGAALAARYNGTDQVAVCFFGDGASNEGTFHEALNMASLWKLPVIFVCENNLYGVSTRQDRHQTIEDVAQRAAGYSMPGLVVDGNDVVAVYEAVAQAVKRARMGSGPTLIECKTYRWYGHSLREDGSAYRSVEEVESWKKKDPLAAFRDKILAMGAATKEDTEKIHGRVVREIEDAVRFAEESPLPEPEELYQDVYTEEAQ